MKKLNQISKEKIEILNKIDNPTIEEILKLSNQLQLDKMVLVKFFIEKETNINTPIK